MDAGELDQLVAGNTCRFCGLQVTAASYGGADVCPWCDSGYNRDGTPWTWQQMREWMYYARVTPLGYKRVAGVCIKEEAYEGS